MPDEEKIQNALSGLLSPGERVEHAVVCQPKRGSKSELTGAATALGLSAVASTAASVVGASTGLLVLAVPAAVWVVVTDQRLLMFPRVGINNTTRSIGQLTFAAPRAALRATHHGGLMHTVAVKDATDDQSLVVLRFGVRRAAAQVVAAACTAP